MQSRDAAAWGALRKRRRQRRRRLRFLTRWQGDGWKTWRTMQLLYPHMRWNGEIGFIESMRFVETNHAKS